MNCILYARVSTGRQAKKDLSIPLQFEVMRGFAHQRGLTVVEQIEEPGVTARTPNRPAFKQLMATLVKGDPKVEVVLVFKYDRWMRSVFDHLAVKRQLEHLGVRLISVTEPVEDTAQGRWVENMTASNNEFYSDILSERVELGMRKKVQLGGWPHRPPRGYKLVYDHSGFSHPEPDAGEAQTIRAAFERYATGWHSLRDTADFFKDSGLVSKKGRRLALAYVREMLMNPFYVGRLRWKDLEVAGKHEPLISQSLFERVGAVIQGRFKDPGAKGSVRGFPLRGLAICASCRGHMTASWHKKRFGYYSCSRRSYNQALCAASKYCPAQLAEQQVSGVCRSLQLSEETSAEIIRRADLKIRDQASRADQAIASWRAKRSSLVERELALTERYVAGEIAPEAFQLTSKKIRTELSAVEVAMEKAGIDATTVLRGVREVLERATSIQTLGDELGHSLRPPILRAVFSDIVLGADGLVGFTLREPFGTIFKVGPTGNGARLPDAHLDTLASELVGHITTEAVMSTTPGSSPAVMSPSSRVDRLPQSGA